MIRSGCNGFGLVPVGVADVELDGDGGRGGWKDCGGISNPLPLKILSVVAITFPPFRCRSHMIVLLDTCGNICCTRSTSASLARALLVDEVLFRDGLGVEKKKYRMARPPSSRTKISCGTFMVCSEDVAILMTISCATNKQGVKQ